jgi:hypothetical protein
VDFVLSHNSCGDGRLGRQRSEATPVWNGHSGPLLLTLPSIPNQPDQLYGRSISKLVILSEARHWRSQGLAQSKDRLPAGATTALVRNFGTDLADAHVLFA